MAEGGPGREYGRLDAAAHLDPAAAHPRQQAAVGVGVPALLDVPSDVARVEQDVAALRHARDQQAGTEARRQMGQHLVDAGRNAGAVAAVVAPRRLDDVERARQAPGGEHPEGAVVALRVAAEQNPLHGHGVRSRSASTGRRGRDRDLWPGGRVPSRIAAAPARSIGRPAAGRQGNMFPRRLRRCRRTARGEMPGPNDRPGLLLSAGLHGSPQQAGHQGSPDAGAGLPLRLSPRVTGRAAMTDITRTWQ